MRLGKPLTNTRRQQKQLVTIGSIVFESHTSLYTSNDDHKQYIQPNTPQPIHPQLSPRSTHHRPQPAPPTNFATACLPFGTSARIRQLPVDIASQALLQTDDSGRPASTPFATPLLAGRQTSAAKPGHSCELGRWASCRSSSRRSGGSPCCVVLRAFRFPTRNLRGGLMHGDATHGPVDGDQCSVGDRR